MNDVTRLYNKMLVTLEKGIEDVEKFMIHIPNIEEQKKIASFLNSVDKKIELVETQIQQSKTFKKGLLQQMFV